MGYAVLHLDKASGNEAKMTAHIERTQMPKNADPERTHLNCELIVLPEGVSNRTEAIQHRLDTAGLTRKIGTNQVEITLREKMFSIANTGIDDTPLDAEKIFRRFSRTSEERKGNGLGLSIVRRICDLHGWSVSYELVNRRHTFTVNFEPLNINHPVSA